MTKQEQTRWNKPKRTGEIIDEDYLSWIHDCPCMVCGCYEVEAHHIRLRSTNARNDHKVVPLCPDHHRGTYSPHGKNAGAFKVAYPNKFMEELADDYYDTYKKHNGGVVPYWHVYENGANVIVRNEVISLSKDF